MKNSLLILSLFSFFIYSCSKTTEKVISKESIAIDYEKLKEESNLSGRQDTVLNMLVTLSKGRDKYIEENDLDEDAAKILVNDEEFNKVTKELFDDLTTSEVRYEDLLTEIANLDIKQII